MKKITLITFLLLLNLTYSQEVLNETFDSAASLPAGWTNTNTTGSAELWTFSDNTDFLYLWAAGNGFFNQFSGGSGNNALFDSNAYGAAELNDVYLTSPIFDCSALTDIKLSYGYFIFASAIGYDGAGFIEVFDGTSWVSISEYSSNTIDVDASGYYWDYGEVLIDVSNELAGVSNAQFRVRFSEITNQAWGMKIDNILIQQPLGDAPDVVTNMIPADGATNVEILTNNATPPSKMIDFNFTPATTGTPALFFDFHFGMDEAASLGSILDVSPEVDVTWGATTDAGWQPNTTYYWYITARNAVGSTNSPIYSFTTGPVDPLGTEDYQENEFKVYPNPVNDMLNIDGNVRIDSLEVINQLGQRVLNINGSSLFNNQVNLGKLKSGLYFIKLTSNDKTEIIQIIKQ